MSKISSPDTTTTTAVVQRIELPETQAYYTLRNTGAESIWWHSSLAITDATVNALASTAAGRTAGLSELKVGETNCIMAHNAWIKAVWDVDGGAGSTLDIEPGQLSPDTIIQAGDLNIGNVDIDTYHSGQTILFARIDDDTITGGTYSAAWVGAVAAKKIYVVELLLTVSAQSELEWVEDPQGTPAILATAPPHFFAQRGGIYLPDAPGYHFATNTANKALGMDEVDNGTVKVRGYLKYYTAA